MNLHNQRIESRKCWKENWKIYLSKNANHLWQNCSSPKLAWNFDSGKRRRTTTKRTQRVIVINGLFFFFFIFLKKNWPFFLFFNFKLMFTVYQMFVKFGLSLSDKYKIGLDCTLFCLKCEHYSLIFGNKNMIMFMFMSGLLSFYLEWYVINRLILLHFNWDEIWLI